MRRLPWPTRRFAVSGALTAFVLFVVALSLFLVVRPGQRPVTQELASDRNPRAEQALILEAQAHGGRDCHPTQARKTVDDAYIGVVRASAVIICRPIGTGPDRLLVMRFADERALTHWERDNHNNVAGDGDACEGSMGETPWASIDGRIAGTLYCESEGTDSTGLAWTDHPTSVGYYVSKGSTSSTTSSRSSETHELLAWWRRYAKGEAYGDPSALTDIKATFGRAIVNGLGRCRQGGDALADLVLRCGPVKPKGWPSLEMSSLTIFHFANARLLSAFFDNYARTFRAPQRDYEQSCATASLASTEYQYNNRPAGQVFCFPAGNAQWILWTITGARLAAMISDERQDSKRLYQAWQAIPAG